MRSCAAITAIVCAVLAAPDGALGQVPGITSAVAVSDGDLARVAPIAVAADDFAALALDDYRKALERYASAEARARFTELDREVWDGLPPRLGWSYLFNVAAVAYAAPGSVPTLVAFYHPWADVFLVTAWRADADSARLIDAEVVTGDWVRDRLRAPKEGRPLWQRTEVYTPGAFGMLAALSVRALERRIAQSGGSDWRKALGLAGDRAVVAANRRAATALLADALGNTFAFAQPAPDESAVLGDVRLEMALAFKRLGDGDVAGVLAIARDTLPETAALLRALPADYYLALRSANVAIGPEQALMFMVPPAPDGYCLAFAFTREGDTVALRRIDVIRYASAYEQVARTGSPSPERKARP